MIIAIQIIEHHMVIHSIISHVCMCTWQLVIAPCLNAPTACASSTWPPPVELEFNNHNNTLRITDRLKARPLFATPGQAT